MFVHVLPVGKEDCILFLTFNNIISLKFHFDIAFVHCSVSLCCKYSFIIHLYVFLISLLLLFGMVATTSTARTLTVQKKQIKRLVRQTCTVKSVHVYCWGFYLSK